ncbi:MAG: protein-glutamate O-methyltransferase CheR [Anaerolineae bacterium]|nr:protein-glutamate O-methyltransferase CheR [Gemmatimonadaceae bacterium]
MTMGAPPETDVQFSALMEKISRERGFGCASYKEKCLRRRIAVRMRATAVHTYESYASILDRDDKEYDLLLDALTINVTKLFRNWDAFERVARNVIPAIWQGQNERIRVWSAGCASGEEPYSLAILFHRHALMVRETRRLNRVGIVATDIDRGSLTAAARGAYQLQAFADTPDEIRRAYFSPDYPAEVVPEVKALVRFERRDLLREAPPETGLQLILCRNVIIYFDRATQEALFERFHAALAPGGFLVLGKVETLLGAIRTRFAAVDARERIFRKL